MKHEYNLFVDSYISQPSVAASYCNRENIKYYHQRNWETVKTFDEFKYKIETRGIPNIISLDYKLSCGNTARDCIKFLKRFIDNNNTSKPNVKLSHSLDSVGERKTIDELNKL